MVELELKNILGWCKDNDVAFKITDKDGLLAVSASLRNMSAEYAVKLPATTTTLGHAIWASLYTIRHATEFHRREGFIPEGGHGIGDDADQLGDSDGNT